MIVEASGVLFDSDGVLIDSRAHVEAAWRTLSDRFGLEFDVLVSELSGVRAVDTLTRHLDPVQASEAVARLEDLEVELAAGVVALPGAVELCASLPSGRWAVVTSASRRLAHARWAGAGLNVDAVTVTGDDVERGKPDPSPFLAAAAGLGVEAAGCVVFEDSPSGGQAGRTAGATVVAVGDAEWSFEPAARISDLSAVNVTLGSVGELELRLSTAG